MSYQHDVFISYKRELNWTPWTRDHFKVLLQSYLQQDLGRSVDIFVDERIETLIGRDWVVDLATHLAKSRVVVVLFSRDYFASDWCIHELDLILERIKQAKSAVNRDYILVIPVIGHDGELIPEPFNRLNMADVKNYRIACMNKQSLDYHEFSKIIRNISPQVANAVNEAPEFDASWVAACVDRFEAIYKAQERGDHLPPMHLTLKPLPAQTAPPRLRV